MVGLPIGFATGGLAQRSLCSFTIFIDVWFQSVALVSDEVSDLTKEAATLVRSFRNDIVRCYVGFHAHPRRLVEVVLASVDNSPLV